MDGKTFADQEMIIALGVTIDGHKVPLGFVQAASEVDPLNDRGLQYQPGAAVPHRRLQGIAGCAHQGALRICSRAAGCRRRGGTH